MEDLSRKVTSSLASRQPAQGHVQAMASLLSLMHDDYMRGRSAIEDALGSWGKRQSQAQAHFHSLVGSLGLEVVSGLALLREGLSAPPFLAVRCFGSFEVWSAGEKIAAWPGSRAKTVLKYLLAHHPRPVARDKLLEALWPETAPEVAGNRLRVAVHGLRRALGQQAEGTEAILFREGGYALHPALELWVDVELFEKHFQHGLRLEQEGKGEEALAEHGLAEELYRGDYLEEDIYEEWTWLRREALRDLYLRILAKARDYCAQAGDYDGCILRCQKILQQDPCREDAYRWLMRCHARLGQRSRAMEWFRLCQQTLKRELDSPLDEETLGLHRLLLKGQAI